jgi:hypothetical protein
MWRYQEIKLLMDAACCVFFHLKIEIHTNTKEIRAGESAKHVAICTFICGLQMQGGKGGCLQLFASYLTPNVEPFLKRAYTRR